MAASLIMLLEQKSVHRLLTGQHNEMHGMIELVLTWGSVIMLWNKNLYNRLLTDQHNKMYEMIALVST